MELPALPLFMNERNKAAVGVAVFAFAMGIYLLCNRFHFFPPRALPLTWVDRNAPFLPLTFWVYNSEYVFFLALYAAASNLRNLNKFVYSIIAIEVVSCLIFVLWPTAYPRELFPLPASLDPVTAWGFTLMRGIDTPASCCPSLHVSAVYLASFIFRDEKRRLFPWFLAWATTITISTMTTKQHYFLDVLSGFALAMAFYWFFHRKARYSPTRFAADPA